MAVSTAYTSYLLFPPVPRASSPSQSPLSSSKSIFISNGGRDFLKMNCNAVITSSRAPRSPSIHCLFGLGVPELVVIAGVAALVFGPKKLPEIGRSIGKTVKSFQQAAKEFETELKKEPGDEAESPPEKPTTLSEGEKEDLEVAGKKESL